MLAFLGDIHGDAQLLARVMDTLQDHPQVTALIQVGDFGFYPQNMPYFYEIEPHIPIYVIDGNHEYHSMFRGLVEITELATNIFFVPRGTVMQLDGRTVGFMGGALSINKDNKIKQGIWFADEEISHADIARMDGVQSVDILVTHTPPTSVIQAHFPSVIIIGSDEYEKLDDPSADRVEELWNRLGRPLMFCGHMHRHVVEGNCHILDINEVYAV